MSIRRPVSSTISSDLLQRLALAAVVLFWSVSPLLPWSGSGSAAYSPTPVVQAIPGAGPVLAGRPDTTSRIAQWRPFAGLGIFADGDDAAAGDDPIGPALARDADQPIGAVCTGFVAAHHAFSECARRALRRSGRAPPAGQHSA